MRALLSISCLSFVACGGEPTTLPDASRGDSGPRTDSGPARDSGGAVDSGHDGGDRDSGSGCEYPAGAVEPMTRGAVLWPYRWPEAIDGMGRNFPLDLSLVRCTADPNIDWSPFDVLVFIAIPAW